VQLRRSAQKPVTANLGSQATPAPHGLFRSGCECHVHPIAGATFLGPKKADALELKLNSDQFIQTDATGDHVPTKNVRSAVPNPKLQAKILIRFFLEVSDLAFVIFFVAEVPVPRDSLSGDALNLSHIDGRMVAGRLFVVADVVVPSGNEQMKYLKINANHGSSIVRVNFQAKPIAQGSCIV